MGQREKGGLRRPGVHGRTRLAWALVAAVASSVGLAGESRASRQEILRWTHPNPAEVSGFRIYVGTQSGVYLGWRDVGLPASVGGVYTADFWVRDDATAFFAVSAYGPTGVESALSNERRRDPATAPPPPADPPDGGTSDGGTSDGGTSDGGTSDGGTSDGGTSDGGTSDGGTSDGGTSDGGTSDGGAPGEETPDDEGGGSGVPSSGESLEILLSAPLYGQWLWNPSWRLVATGDLDGDSRDDLIWYEGDRDRHTAWYMDGYLLRETADLPLGEGARVVGSRSLLGHLANDREEILWVDAADRLWASAAEPSGALASWDLEVLPSWWRQADTGDFDGDGRVDLLWRGHSTLNHTLWLLDWTGVAEALTLAAPSGWFRRAGSADLDADGDADLLWQDTAPPGGIWYQTMEGGVPEAARFLAPAIPDYRIGAAADVNGDGRDDLVLSPTTAPGPALIWMSQPAGPPVAVLLGWIPTGDQTPHPADLDGDGDDDLIWTGDPAGQPPVVWFMAPGPH